MPEPGTVVADAPRGPSERPGFVAGFRALLAGASFLARSPALWPLAVVPVLAAIVVGGLLAVVAIELVPPAVERLTGEPTSAALRYAAVAARWLLTGAAVVLSFFVGVGLAQPISGPALEQIVRASERDVGAPEHPPTGIVSDVLRSAQSVLVSAAFGLPILGLLFFVDLIVPGAVVVTVPLKAFVVALLFAWDLCDYPLPIRGVAVRTRIALVRRSWRCMVGLGAGIALVSLLPCAMLLVLPAGAAGAARLVAAIEGWEADQHPRA